MNIITTAADTDVAAARRPRRRLLRTILAGLAVATIGSSLAATEASAATGDLTINTSSFIQTPGTKKALVVLLENGGFSFGLPENFTVGVPSCSTFRLPVGSNDLVAYIGSIWNSLLSAPTCLDPGNWRTVQVPVAQYVTGASEPVIEGATAASVSAAASTKYDKVVILQNTDFNATKVRQTLSDLAFGYVIDVHVLSHGNRGVITGGGGDLRPADVAGFATIPWLRIRSVYQQNCFGSSMNSAWVSAGARVVTGANLINNMPLAYGSFLNRWLSGQSFATAVNGSTSDWRPFFSTVYRHVDMYDGNQVKRNPMVFDTFGNLSSTDEMAESVQVMAGNTALTIAG